MLEVMEVMEDIIVSDVMLLGMVVVMLPAASIVAASVPSIAAESDAAGVVVGGMLSDGVAAGASEHGMVIPYDEHAELPHEHAATIVHQYNWKFLISFRPLPC